MNISDQRVTGHQLVKQMTSSAMCFDSHAQGWFAQVSHIYYSETF
jgi:hypothetical protein